LQRTSRRSPEGFLSSGVTIDKAREVARAIWNDGEVYDRPATDVPFSLGSKRVFEAAIEHSRKMGHNYIAPKHITIALFNVNDDAGVTSLLQRMDKNDEQKV
jgi:ATP-dependent Clp protease ATP-binding subunit ClpC